MEKSGSHGGGGQAAQRIQQRRTATRRLWQRCVALGFFFPVQPTAAAAPTGAGEGREPANADLTDGRRAAQQRCGRGRRRPRGERGGGGREQDDARAIDVFRRVGVGVGVGDGDGVWLNGAADFGSGRTGISQFQLVPAGDLAAVSRGLAGGGGG